MKVATFDLETRENPAVCGWKNYAAMGISFGCIHSDWNDESLVFGEDEILQAIEVMREADVITGFNILGFDNPLLKATLDRLEIAVEDWTVLVEKCYDPFNCVKIATKSQIPKGWKLDNIAKSVLTVCKSGDGAEAPGLWQRGEHETLRSYVKQDVVVESELFKYCRKHKTLTNNFISILPVTVGLVGMRALCEKFAWVEAEGLEIGDPSK